MEKTNEKHVLFLDDDTKERLIKSVHSVIDLFEKDCKNIEEKAFCLRILMETFEETQRCVVPFKNRYTEPVHIYQDFGVDE